MNASLGLLPSHMIEKKQLGKKITMLTAYDAVMGQMLDAAQIDMILVGDSVANVVAGHAHTLPMTMDQMIYHTQCVGRGISRSLLVADMPFMSYQTSVSLARENAGRFLKETAAKAVKIELTASLLPTVRSLTDIGIPVMGHIGLTPQLVYQLGGYHVQGKTTQLADGLQLLAKQAEESGCFSLVLECIPFDLARCITTSLLIPTIGIGAGPWCDGQVLVTHDMVGLTQKKPPFFVKQYAQVYVSMQEAVRQFKMEVETERFPNQDA